jgi:alpha-1,6-mannosyltransferase
MQTQRRLISLRALGVLGLLGVLCGSFLLAAGAASTPAPDVPGAHGGFPGWLSGPLGGLHLRLEGNRFQLVLIGMAAGYALVLATVRVLPGRLVWPTIIAAHGVLLLGPVLFSQDLFGYLSYARLGVLHGLDPYTHTAAADTHDAVYRFLGWHGVSSPYGPLFTLGSYALVPFGVAGGVWALKLLATLASLLAVLLLARAAGLAHPAGPARATEMRQADLQAPDGRAHTASGPGVAAAALVGLNPVLLAFAVGGGHNDTIIVALLAAALLVSGAAATGTGVETATEGNPRGDGAARRANPRAALGLLVAAAGVKLSAGLALPFLILAPATRRARLQRLCTALVGLLVVAVIGVLGFGTHALGFLGAVRGEQQLVAVHSVPAELARLLGMAGTPGWWRDCFAALFVIVLGWTLWRTTRGADWRAMAGWATLGLLLCTAWLLPWYAIWPLPFAAVSEDRRLRMTTLAFCAYVLLTRLPFANPLLSP